MHHIVLYQEKNKRHFKNFAQGILKSVGTKSRMFKK